MTYQKYLEMNKINTQDIEIREAKPSEAETLTKIAYAAKRYWGYPEAYIDLWADSLVYTPDRIKDTIVYAAVLDDQVAGFCALIPAEADGVYEMDGLWVKPEYIGQGVGRQLFKHATEMVQAKGGRELRLEADPNAVGFYKKMGMVRIGESLSKPEGRKLDVMALTVPVNDKCSFGPCARK
jgi:ribosomal protein S18 acetylase RimI-like enzyme